MKILHLTLKKQWFDMTVSNVKKEDYLEITDYWMTRFIKYRPSNGRGLLLLG